MTDSNKPDTGDHDGDGNKVTIAFKFEGASREEVETLKTEFLEQIAMLAGVDPKELAKTADILDEAHRQRPDRNKAKPAVEFTLKKKTL